MESLAAYSPRRLRHSQNSHVKERAMHTSPRRVTKIIEPEPVVEGAGVRLRRSIATPTLDYLDPFLLLDHFASRNPDEP